MPLEAGGDVPIKSDRGACNCAAWTLKKKVLIGVGTAVGMIGIAVGSFLLYRYLNRGFVQVKFSATGLTARRLSANINDTQYPTGDGYWWPSTCVRTTPSDWEMKLIAVYVAEDVDPITQNNKGATVMVWLNDECKNDISNCNIIPNYKHHITSFFNFSRPIDEVNAQLNSQKMPVAMGTYRYVRMEFCKSMPGDDFNGQSNVRFQAANMSEPYSFVTQSCGITTKATEPLEIKKGSQLVLNLAYSLDYVSGFCPGMTGVSCDTTGSQFCTAIPKFYPTATVL